MSEMNNKRETIKEIVYARNNRNDECSGYDMGMMIMIET